VLQEAMQVGLPIVATNNGGQIDFIKDGENGFLVDTNNSEIIAEKIKELLNNDVLKNKMLKQNLADVKHFNVSNIAKEYIHLIYV
jgi:glycosyltransferase involved in cell wall biosynthesis